MNKKQLIIETAIELFAKKGIESTSVQQITEACDISKGAFYLVFSSKEELVLSVIDYFMKSIVAEIDQSVRVAKTAEEGLLRYYETTFRVLDMYKDYAQVFMREQPSVMSERLIHNLHYYDSMLNKLLLGIFEEVFGKEHELKYDLLIVSKGFVSAYSQLMFTLNMKMDVPLIAASVVERIKLIAEHSRLVVFNHTYLDWLPKEESRPVTIQDVEREAAHVLSFLQEPLLVESVELLSAEVKKAAPSPAITEGMLRNLEGDERCRWFMYVVRQFMS